MCFVFNLAISNNSYYSHRDVLSDVHVTHTYTHTRQEWRVYVYVFNGIWCNRWPGNKRPSPTTCVMQLPHRPNPSPVNSSCSLFLLLFLLFLLLHHRFCLYSLSLSKAVAVGVPGHMHRGHDRALCSHHVFAHITRAIIDHHLPLNPDKTHPILVHWNVITGNGWHELPFVHF